MHKEYKIKKILFRIILILLFLPILQKELEFAHIAPLGGYEPKVDDIKYSIREWKSAEFQEKKEAYLKANFGFANWLIRSEHQWAFSAYGMPRNDNLIVGKENYVYEEFYIQAKKGIGFLGKDSIAVLAHRIKALQDTLNSMNKHFLFVLAPNKADYYPEYIPAKYATTDPELTNYKVLRQELISRGIQHLDINHWFMSMKDTTSIPLFAKTGTHYNTYGAAMTVKHITAKLEQQMQKDLPDVSWKELTWSDTPLDRDDDLEKALNLWFRIKNRPLAYPKMLIDKQNKHRPSAITIGDSFYYELLELGLNYEIFNNGKFWYYNSEVIPQKTLVSSLNLESEINNTELVIMIITDGNIRNCLGYFINPLYLAYFGNNKEVKIKEMIQKIKNSPEWLNSIKQKAEANKIPLEKMIYLDAEYVVNTQK